MNFQQLRFVVAVAETSSFTSAADICCVTQPALSNAIAQFEEEMGAKLFERTTRSVELTPFGETMMPGIRNILEEKTSLLIQSSEYLVDGLRQKSLGLGFPSALFCATVVDAYRNIIHGFRFPSQAA